MHELEGFHVFQALGNDPDSGKPVLQMVRIRDDRDKKMSFELHPGNELASVNVGDRLIVGMVDRSLESSDFLVVEKRWDAEKVRAGDLEWRHLSRFREYAPVRTRREEGAESGLQQEKSAGSENEPNRAMRGQEEKQGSRSDPGASNRAEKVGSIISEKVIIEFQPYFYSVNERLKL